MRLQIITLALPSSRGALATFVVATVVAACAPAALGMAQPDNTRARHRRRSRDGSRVRAGRVRRLERCVPAMLVWPFIWGLTEQMTYNGYLVSRFQVLFGRTSMAVAVVAFVWSMQHAFLPLTFDAKFMTFRLVASIPFSIFETLFYLRLRRLIPLALAHALMDGATELIPLLGT